MRLTARQFAHLSEIAREHGVPRGTMLGLLVEASLALDWATSFGVGSLDVPASLNQVERSAAHARYLTWLTFERRGPSHDVEDEPVTLPVRIIDRATPAAVDQALRQSPKEAIAFEIAAVRAGLTIGEWVARRAAELAVGRRQAL